jgi:hypothetical protein
MKIIDSRLVVTVQPEQGEWPDLPIHSGMHIRPREATVTFQAGNPACVTFEGSVITRAGNRHARWGLSVAQYDDRTPADQWPPCAVQVLRLAESTRDGDGYVGP